MAQYAPDGMLLEVLDKCKGEAKQQNPDGTLQREGDHGGAGNSQGDGHGRPPFHVKGHGTMGGPGGAHRHGSIREYDLDPPRPPNILDQLVATLCDASLEGTPQFHQWHRPDTRYPGRRNPHRIEEDNSDEEEEDDTS